MIIASLLPACDPGVIDSTDGSDIGDDVGQPGDETGDEPTADHRVDNGVVLDDLVVPGNPACVATDWTWPVPAAPGITQHYGNEISYQTCGFHTGLDIGAADGTDIVASATGTVVHVGPMWYAGESQGRGPYAIIIDHGDGVFSTYGHNSESLVEQGDCVSEGQTIALIGNLGYSFGPHLHFEVLAGTQFTGDWSVPFSDACAHYINPMDLIDTE